MLAQWGIKRTTGWKMKWTLRLRGIKLTSNKQLLDLEFEFAVT